MADQKLSELTINNAVLGTDSRLYSVVDPSGSPLAGYTKYESIRDQISSYIGGAGNPLDNLLWVAKNGNDTTGDGSSGKPYLTITKALTEITTAGQTILVAPGTYTETLTFTQNDTAIIGQQGSGGQQEVIITQTNTNVVDFGTTSRCVVGTCNIQLTAAASTIYAVIIGASGSGKIRFCRTETICTTGGILAGIGYSAGGELVFAHGKVFQTNNVDGDGSEIKAAFRISNGSTLKLSDVKEIDVNTDGSSDHSVIASDEGTSGTIIMESCREANINDDDADCTVLLLLTGSSSSHRFRYNEARVNKSITNPGDGIGICLPSGSCKIHTAFNHMRIGQTSGAGYSFKLASGTEATWRT